MRWRSKKKNKHDRKHQTAKKIQFIKAPLKFQKQHTSKNKLLFKYRRKGWRNTLKREREVKLKNKKWVGMETVEQAKKTQFSDQPNTHTQDNL